jgi:hypothetical protein
MPTKNATKTVGRTGVFRRTNPIMRPKRNQTDYMPYFLIRHYNTHNRQGR